MSSPTSSWRCPGGHEVTSEYCPEDGAGRPVEVTDARTRPVDPPKQPVESAPSGWPVPGVEQIAPNAWQKSEGRATPPLPPSWGAQPKGAGPSPPSWGVGAPLPPPSWGTEPSGWHVPPRQPSRRGPIMAAAVAAVLILGSGIGL